MATKDNKPAVEGNENDEVIPGVSTSTSAKDLLSKIAEVVEGPFRTDPEAAAEYTHSDLTIQKVSLFNDDLDQPVVIDPANLDLETLMRHVGRFDEQVAIGLPIALRHTAPITQHIQKIIPRTGSRAPYHRGAHLTSPAELYDVVKQMMDSAIADPLWATAFSATASKNTPTYNIVYSLLSAIVLAMFTGLDIVVKPPKVVLDSPFDTRWPTYDSLLMVMRHARLLEAAAGLKPASAFDSVREFATMDLCLAAEDYCRKLAAAITEYMIGRRQMLNTGLTLVLARASLKAKVAESMQDDANVGYALAAYMNNANLDALCGNLTVLYAATEAYNAGRLNAKLNESWADASISVLSAVMADTRYFTQYSLPECRKFASVDVITTEAGLRTGVIVDATIQRPLEVPVLEFEQLPATISPSSNFGFLHQSETTWAAGFKDVVHAFTGSEIVDARPVYARLIERIDPITTRSCGFVKLIGDALADAGTAVVESVDASGRKTKKVTVSAVGDLSAFPMRLLLAAAFADVVKLVPEGTGYTFVFGVKPDNPTDQVVDTAGSMLITKDPILTLYLKAQPCTIAYEWDFKPVDLNRYMQGMVDLNDLVASKKAKALAKLDTKLPSIKLKFGPHEVTVDFGSLGAFITGPVLASNIWLRDEAAITALQTRIAELCRALYVIEAAAKTKQLSELASELDARLALTPLYSWLLGAAASTAVSSRMRSYIDAAIQKTQSGPARTEILRSARSAHLSAFMCSRVALNILGTLGLLPARDVKKIMAYFEQYQLDERVGALSDKRVNLARLPIAYF